MNTTQLPLPGIPVPCTLSPVRRIAALAQRALAAFPECRLSWSLILEWAQAQLALQRKWSADILAIDDQMEREAPLLWECLQNDPPAKRRRIWQAWCATHAATERLAPHVSPET